MRLAAWLLAAILGFTSCRMVPVAPHAGDQGRAWVAMEPVQCLGNPWEQDWLASHGWNYQAYPKDRSKPGLEPEEIAIIRDYFWRLGVKVFAVTTRGKYEVVCAACNCPEGYTLYLEVRAQDVERMIALGWREESPAALAATP